MSSKPQPLPEPIRRPGIRTFVDRGGTFTDVVQIDASGKVQIRKVPSDAAIVGQLAVGELVFGTTVATNALLEGKGVPCLLIVSEGFADLVHIGDMRRPDLFDAQKRRPKPLCQKIITVPGRINAQGEIVEALPESALRRLEKMDLTGFEGVAIALLNSNRNPNHELAVAARLPNEIHTALGHQLSPAVDYLGRIETALVDAAISPPLLRAIHRDQIPRSAHAIRSDGSLCPAHELRAPEAVLSGPAGGVLAVEEVARQAGFKKAVGIDMGGTSTDVCRVDVGRIPRNDSGIHVGGHRIRRPVLEVETIAAGGGSVLRNDGVCMRVGPESAGANPGPACYGRGGPPTLTDAALAVGLLNPTAFSPPLQNSQSTIPGRPAEFLAIAQEAMAMAVQRLAVARGVDLHDHALVAYGGAAGQHAAEVAKRLGIRTVLVHPCASVLSAWGQALARREEEAMEAVWRPLNAIEDPLGPRFASLEKTLPHWGSTQKTVGIRVEGTDSPLAVEWVPGVDLKSRFEQEHQRQYGFTRKDASLEVVNLRVRTVASRPSLPVQNEDPFGLGARKIQGPTLLNCPTTSVWVPKGWTARLAHGLLFLESTEQTVRAEPKTRSPQGVALWSHRFMAVAEQAGEKLRRLGRSVTIRERLDFSCAIFDTKGHLVANAPHIPVHLGAMGATIRDLLQQIPNPSADQSWLCNDPAAGGSHLPDLTVIRCVVHDGHRFFVANRAHHVDVGGLTPGSMPPHSKRLSEEGVVFRHLPLLEAGHLVDLRPLLTECRDPDSLLADLEAQLAANNHAAIALCALGSGDLIAHWMGHLQDVAEEQVLALIKELPLGSAADELDGIPLCLRLEKVGTGLRVDFSGTGGPHPGNLNAPQAVQRAAILYGLRCLAGPSFPLNEGALRPVSFRVPEPSILRAPEGAAVVGGNVETSQRITDLFLRAAEAQAGSQGTMNNLSLGGIHPVPWAYYETIGGGSGACEKGPGVSGVQVHMTNTSATDPEILEARLPISVRKMAYRRGSGGGMTEPDKDLHPGGDGLIRELELLAPAQVALLASRRKSGANGLHGAPSGTPGNDSLFYNNAWYKWDGKACTLEAGDRIRIETPGGGGWRPPNS
jgi:5-oxoprolinase (ATP-hydrolysing)